MKRFIIVSVLLVTLFAFTSSASAIGIRGAVVLSNSNLYGEMSGSSTTMNLNLHYGVEADASFSIAPMIDILFGLTYYLPAGSSDLEDIDPALADETVAFMPINVAAKFSIPGLGVTGMNPYAGLGLNYTFWTIADPAPDEQPTAGLGYYGFVGAEFGSIFAELGYTIMTATVKDMMGPGEAKLESRGIYFKGGMLLGI